MSELIACARDDRGVYTLEICRPEVRNALNPETFVELVACCTEIDTDPGARAVVLRGRGCAFSAGGDFGTLNDLLEGGRDVALVELRNANAGVLALASLRVPTVAALNGDAYGGGATMALACDFRLMAATARLGFVFARLGLSGADTGATWWLTRLLGAARTLEILGLGRVFSADEALDAGLVTEVAPTDRFDATVDAFASRLAALAPRAVQGTKRALAGIESRSLAAQLDLEADIQADVICTADFSEGLAAFTDKRSAQFKGE